VSDRVKSEEAMHRPDSLSLSPDQQLHSHLGVLMPEMVVFGHGKRIELSEALAPLAESGNRHESVTCADPSHFQACCDGARTAVVQPFRVA